MYYFIISSRISRDLYKLLDKAENSQNVFLMNPPMLKVRHREKLELD